MAFVHASAIACCLLSRTQLDEMHSKLNYKFQPSERQNQTIQEV